MPQLLFAIGMLALMWLLLIRPQQQRVRARQALVASLVEGDEVITAGGLFGRIVELEPRADPPALRLQIADGIVIRVATAAVARPVGQPAPTSAEGPDGTA